MTRRPKLRVVGESEGQAEERPTFIGPDYAALRSVAWDKVHTRSDKREPLPFDFGRLAGRMIGEDKRRFER